MNHEDDKWIESAAKNAATLESEIDDLNNGHWDMMRRQYREFFEHAKKISEMFKTLRPLTSSDRQKLWEKFNGICREVKQRQTSERESRLQDSKLKRDLVEGKIRESYFTACSASTRSEFDKAKYLLNQSLEWMKNGWGGFNVQTDLLNSMMGREGKMTKEDHDVCWEKWKDASEAFRLRKEEIWTQNYDHFRDKAYGALSEARSGNLKEAKESVKSVQKDLKGVMMKKEQFQSISELLEEAWAVASERLKERYEEGQRRHQEWLRKQEEFIERLSDAVSRKEELIERVEGQIDKLRDMENNARSDDFADKVRSWIEEKEDFIRSVRDDVQDIEQKIRDTRTQLER